MLGEGIEQLCVFVVFAALGLGLSAVYVFSVGLTRSRLSAIIFDCVFGAAAVFCVFITNLNVNNGEFRLFVFLGIAAGAVICLATCKTLLDKASQALYNLFTEKSGDKVDGTHILQQKNVNTVRSSDAGTVASGVYAANDADSNGVDEQSQGASAGNGGGKSGKRKSHRRADRVLQNKRVRNRVGGKNGLDKKRRLTVDKRTGQR